MSDFIACFAADGTALTGAAHQVAVRAVSSRLSLAYPGAVTTHCNSHCWVLATGSNVVLDADGTLAMHAGFVAAPLPAPAKLRQLLAHQAWQDLPDGHYSLVTASPGHGVQLLRSLSGGERLYVVRYGAQIWFASSLRLILSHPDARHQFNHTCLAELLATGLVLFGDRTAVAEVKEVLPGQMRTFQGTRVVDQWFWHGLLKAPSGPAATLARKFRDDLTAGVAASVAGSGTVAVSLSGGIDSAAIACCAVDAVGAKNVHAYTYTFDDPSHSDETPYARAVCKKLGINNHQVFSIGLDQFINTIPETVWRAESAVYWPKAFMLLFAKRLRHDGFDRVLSGFGIGSHLGTLQHIGAVYHHAGWHALLNLYWRMAFRHGWRQLGVLEHLHPALALPSLRLLYWLSWLRSDSARQVTSVEASRFFARPLRQLMHALAATGDLSSQTDGEQLSSALHHESFNRLLSCIDVTRWEKPLRELGIARISPAHFASVLPYAYLPYEPGPGRFSADRLLRPGKHLLREAFLGDIPDSVRTRKKNWGDAVISPRWMKAGVGWMRAASQPFEQHELYEHAVPVELLRRWDQRSPQATVTSLAFWYKIMLRRNGELANQAQAPTWRELLA